MNSLEQFLNTLLADLDELPVYLSESTKEYYESYFIDAKEEGLSETEILSQLGDPINISSQIKLDYYMYQPKQAKKVFQKLLSLIFSKSAFASTSKLILGIVSYIISVAFYITQIILMIGGIGVLAISVYLIFENGIGFNDKAIALGSTGLLAFSLMMISAVILKAISFSLRKLINSLVRDNSIHPAHKKTKKFKPAIIFYSVLAILSVVFIMTSPIYQKLSNIWLSIPPTEYTEIEYALDETDIHEIIVDTLHANIIISYGDVETVTLRYEKPTYLDFYFYVLDGKLQVSEFSTGEIPYLEDFARHEGTLDLEIVLPRSLNLDSIDIDSVGSNMKIEVNSYDLDIHTTTSNIELLMVGDYDMVFETKRGSVLMDGVNSRRYNLLEGNDNTIKIHGVSTLIEGESVGE